MKTHTRTAMGCPACGEIGYVSDLAPTGHGIPWFCSHCGVSSPHERWHTKKSYETKSVVIKLSHAALKRIHQDRLAAEDQWVDKTLGRTASAKTRSAVIKPAREMVLDDDEYARRAGINTKRLDRMLGLKRKRPISFTMHFDDPKVQADGAIAALRRKKRVVITMPLSDVYEARITATVTSVRRVRRRP